MASFSLVSRLVRLGLGFLATARLLLATVPLPTDDATFTPKEIAQGYRDGVIIARPRAAQTSTADAAEEREGRTVRHRFARLGGMRLLGPASGESTEEAIARLKATGRYDVVEPDRIIRARVVPNDPSFASQWALRNTGQDSGTSGADIAATGAWDTLHDAPNVIVAVIDSGMRLTHGDLAGNLWTNASPSSTGYTNDLHGINATVAKTNPSSGNPADANGHGTHVAGIIGAVGNNAVGVAGVAWKVQLMPLRFLSADGTGSTSANLACIDYAIAHGAHIINASYGSTTYSEAEFAAIQTARDAGIVFVAAAGNDSANSDVVADYPAAYALDNIVSVAASTRSDTLASFSNYGSGSVDLAAPGESILSTYYSSDTSYQTLSGTSMATPYVVGALALLKVRYPSETYRQLINRLLRGTAPLSSLSGKVQSGGRLDLARALATDSNTPFNDAFAARATLAGANVRVRASATGATSEAGEPAHAGVSGGPTLWWTWTAPETSTVTFDTAGSAYTAAVAIYTGSALGSLQSLSAASGKTTLSATAGTTYQIAIAGASGAAGVTVLKIGTIPANDTFAGAQLVSGKSIRLEALTLNASRESGEPTIAGVTGGHSLWYRWVAPAAGHYMLAAFSTEVNTLAAVYTGASLSSLALVAANNNASTVNSDALVGFDATAGTTYYFQIDHSDSTGGSVTITLTDSLWQYATGDAITSSPAVGSDGTVYVGSAEGYLYAIAADGTLRWRAATLGTIELSSPAVGSDGTVYIGANDGYLYAFNGSTGTRRWRIAMGSEVYSAPALGSDGTVYVRDDYYLHAITPGTSSATRKWYVALSGATYSSPSVALDGTIYVGGTGGALHAFNADGTQKWKFTADDDIYTSPAIGQDGTVYIATLSGTVYAVNSGGTQKWSWHLSAASNSITSSLALGTDGTLYFASYNRQLHALTGAGTEKWSCTLGDEVRASSPVVGADGTIYVGTYDGRVYAVSASGAVVRDYATAALVRSSPLLSGGRLYFGSSDAKLYAFAVAQEAAASTWPMYRQNVRRSGRVTSGLATLTSQPISQAVVLGGTLTLSVTATSDNAIAYQWYKDGVAIAGATSSTYTIANVTAAAAGSYTVIATTSLGSVTSDAAVVTVEAAVIGKLANLSVRATAGADARTLIVGFSVSGTKPLLIRGIGPSLGTYGVSDAMTDPIVTVYNAEAVALSSNDNWGGTSDLSTLFGQVGAFSLASTSKDAALTRTFAAGTYSAHITGAAASGSVLAEIYDASQSTGGELQNLSARAQVGGSDSLMAGFVITGNVARQVLIRATGPALAAFGVAGVLANPKLTLYREQSLVSANDNWSTGTSASAIAAAATQVGAFALASGSADAALLVTLAPGSYTALVESGDSSSGVALVEIFAVP